MSRAAFLDYIVYILSRGLVFLGGRGNDHSVADAYRVEVTIGATWFLITETVSSGYTSVSWSSQLIVLEACFVAMSSEGEGEQVPNLCDDKIDLAFPTRSLKSSFATSRGVKYAMLIPIRTRLCNAETPSNY